MEQEKEQEIEKEGPAASPAGATPATTVPASPSAPKATARKDAGTIVKAMYDAYKAKNGDKPSANLNRLGKEAKDALDASSDVLPYDDLYDIVLASGLALVEQDKPFTYFRTEVEQRRTSALSERKATADAAVRRSAPSRLKPRVGPDAAPTGNNGDTVAADTAATGDRSQRPSRVKARTFPTPTPAIR